MENETTPTFTSIEDELAYYRNLAMEYKIKYEDAHQDLEEFQESSRELEAELEAQLEQAEARNKEFRALNARLQLERDHLQESLDKVKTESYNQITSLQDELAHVKSVKDELSKYIRELEQANDDLERAKRATVSSLEDFETRLNLAIERNAFLESELDEKEALAVTVQRLKDEARDLRQELLIQQSSKIPPAYNNDLKAADNLKSGGEVDSNKLTSELQVQVGSPFKSSYTTAPHTVTNSAPLTPVTRISALNIVGDLLRKVGALESKLASCRTFSKENASRIDKEALLSPSSSSPLKIKQLTKAGTPQDCNIPLTL